MKPHLLYIAFWFPPSRASGVYRALATVKMFSEAGWNVTVLTTSTEYFEDEIGSTDVTLLSGIPESVEVVRVPFGTGLTPGVDIRSMNRWSANFPAVWKATRRGAGVSISERYTGWIDPVVAAGIEIDTARRVDHILATGNPYSSFEAARVIADTTGSTFSVDYRDPWTIDVFTGARIGDQATRETERRILDEAEFAFHVNDAIADAYKRAYPANADKQRVVFNGYDPDSIPDPPGATAPPYRFGILGTVNDRWPMAAVFKGWDMSRKDLPEGSELILAGHLGYFEHSREVLESRLPGSESAFRYIGPVHKSDVAGFYDSIDVVILPVPGGPMVTSGKVFEALALGKPIVCVQGEDGGARALLVDHPLSIGADPDADSVRVSLLQAAEIARNLDPSIVAQVRADGERFERRQAMTPMLEAVGGEDNASPPSGGSTGETGEGGEPQVGLRLHPLRRLRRHLPQRSLRSRGRKHHVSPPSGGSTGETGKGGNVSPPSGGSTGETGEGGEPQVGLRLHPLRRLRRHLPQRSLRSRGRKHHVSPPSGGSTGEAGEGGEPRGETGTPSDDASPSERNDHLIGIGPNWLLLLGGVTKTGHRRAQRVAERALTSGLDVVWFDGLVDDRPNTPPDQPSETSGSAPRLVVIVFGEELRQTLSGRMRAGDGLRTSAMGRQLWRVLRKVGGLLQPRACWRAIVKDVDNLPRETPPAGIVYTDDQAITSAWYASRIWKSAPVGTDMPSAS